VRIPDTFDGAVDGLPQFVEILLRDRRGLLSDCHRFILRSHFIRQWTRRISTRSFFAGPSSANSISLLEADAVPQDVVIDRLSVTPLCLVSPERDGPEPGWGSQTPGLLPYRSGGKKVHGPRSATRRADEKASCGGSRAKRITTDN
jgi:hypothetical protein